MRAALPIALPILCGGMFWATVLFDQWLYKRQAIGVGAAAMMELATLIIALISFIFVIKSIYRLARARQVLLALLTLCALFGGLVLLVRGFDAGAALLWAT